MRLIAYVRVSTEKQAREGISLEAQEAKIRAYAKALGHEVVEVCRDDGLSGSLGASERPGLARALWRVEHDQAEGLRRLRGGGEDKEGDDGGDTGIAVTSLSRLSRSVRDILDLVDRAREHDWHIVSLTESLDTSSATGRMVVGLLAVLAQFERELIGERTAEAMSKLRDGGKAFTSQPPYGWKFVDGRMIEDEREQRVLKLVKERLAAGWAHGLIAERLNAGPAFFTRAGRPWNGDDVRRVERSIKRAEAAQ